MQAVYIHIPFCNHICSYCDFPKVLHIENFVDDYLEALQREILDNYEGEKIKSIYVGGGTPSCLSKRERVKLFRILEIFNRSHDCEYTYECNISDVNDELLDDLAQGGVNRVSIGIQSFDKDNLSLLEREAEFNDANTKLNMIRSRGIDNINIDLMYALPNEKLSVLKKDLRLFLKLRPTHISTYSLILEEHTKLLNSGATYVSEELDSKMYETICKTLNKYGYEHYEVSNFSLPGFESKHNLNYWNNGEYYGFGMGASGYKDNFRYNNTKNLHKYIDGEVRERTELMTHKEQMDNELMLGFRKIKGINVVDFYDKYGKNIQDVYPEITRLLASKELIYKDGYLAISPDKIYVMNEILIKII